MLKNSELPSKLTSTRIKCKYSSGWSPHHNAHFVFIRELNLMTTSINVEFAERSFTVTGPPASRKYQKCALAAQLTPAMCFDP